MEGLPASLELAGASTASPDTYTPWDPEDDVSEPESPAPPRQKDKHWDLAFFGAMTYVLVEYTRLPAMFPSLQILQLGKVAVLSGLLGYLVAGQRKNSVRGSIAHIDVMFAWILVGRISGCPHG